MSDPTLSPTVLIDSDHPAVIAFAQKYAVGATDRERAVALYYAVRDEFRYDPYHIDFSVHGMTASTVIAKKYGWCVPKAALLAAACRVAGIPAKVGYADVRNHMSTERMRQMMNTDVYMWHGYTDILLEGVWRKATPAFNIELCERFGLLPLEFDGLADSIYHPYDKAGNRHMEYVRQRGSFNDVPLEAMVADFKKYYPFWVDQSSAIHAADFMKDVETENPAAGA
ncbi:transglutaminase-like domain-containing protein [Eoetvoesiella caeni]|uniref:Transglutaminase superfamily protein n=1 Tax=Eoetvoesiella caeni TaxID=645616 RepID=A0A366HFC2_9BURK|nr:transglutaminase family protein [Eoetvoesiella caeni]MCI2808959.1 transglutaminase family protein [Eoetvoesiella caeni]NYT55540.1 transglutaminase family protein [Eoetvoesiella caeni]RBP40095.1 transglutaminase superfamily protein [Eoetvoesiella caeni]